MSVLRNLKNQLGDRNGFSRRAWSCVAVAGVFPALSLRGCAPAVRARCALFGVSGVRLDADPSTHGDQGGRGAVPGCVRGGSMPGPIGIRAGSV
ncbi:hypothetical protein [Pseudomonas veronii]|uniref:hypothetical protein n=1 Tax=Pseudomonas veronii TaxID=76761 RepID=UPI0012E0BD6C|nr:hypothetical protein [Pseudomonas veronii]